MNMIGRFARVGFVAGILVCSAPAAAQVKPQWQPLYDVLEQIKQRALAKAAEGEAKARLESGESTVDQEQARAERNAQTLQMIDQMNAQTQAMIQARRDRQDEKARGQAAAAAAAQERATQAAAAQQKQMLQMQQMIAADTALRQQRQRQAAANMTTTSSYQSRSTGGDWIEPTGKDCTYYDKFLKMRVIKPGCSSGIIHYAPTPPTPPHTTAPSKTTR